MKKIIIGGLAVLAIGLGMAPAANADPFGVSRHGLREDPLGLPGLPATQHLRRPGPGRRLLDEVPRHLGLGHPPTT